MTGHGAVSVQPATSTGELRRFRDVPYLLHHTDARWRPPVRSFDSWVLDTRRHEYFDRGDAAFFLARRGSTPVGRIAVHHPGGADRSDGRFSSLAGIDDAVVVGALIDAAREWLAEQGIDDLRGPVSWAEGVTEGIRIAGHELPAMTAHPWGPRWYSIHLGTAGGEVDERRPSWIVSLDEAAATPSPTRSEPPPHAGPYGDPALVLEGVAGVPDVSALVATASFRGAWARARQARRGQFERAVCVRCEGDPELLVPRLAEAAAGAGYRELVAPLGPGAPDLVEATFRFR